MIITLCGSARFEPWFVAWNEILTIAGHTVFSLSVFPSQKPAGKDWYTPTEKVELDRAHFRKIDASEAAFFINPWAYMGESTVREWDYARSRDGLTVYALESWGRGNGITENHTEACRARGRQWLPKDASGCAVFHASPRDTYNALGPHSPSLLGPAGTPARLTYIALFGEGAVFP